MTDASSHGSAASTSARARFDVVIVGGSFAGLAAALQLARARRRVLLLEGGPPRNQAAATAHGFLTQEGESPAAMLDRARAQLRGYPTLTVQASRAVDAGERSDAGLPVTLDDGRVVMAARLILAHGVRDLLPAIDGLADRWGESVLHCPYCHGYEQSDRRLGVLWGGDFSAHRAVTVREWSDAVTLFTGGVALNDETRAFLRTRDVAIEERPIVALLGEGRRLAAVRLADDAVMALDALFIAPRLELASDLPRQLGCTIEAGGFGPYVKVDDYRLTSIWGVYAAGDLARSSHTIAWAVADGVSAGIAAHQSIIAAR